MNTIMVNSDQPAHKIDTSGLYCPEPVMMLHNKIREVAAGDLIALIATDPSTQRDVPKFCHFLGHQLIESSQSRDVFHYLIRKG